MRENERERERERERDERIGWNGWKFLVSHFYSLIFSLFKLALEWKIEQTSLEFLFLFPVWTKLGTRIRTGHFGAPLELVLRTKLEQELELGPLELHKNMSSELNWNDNCNGSLLSSHYFAFQRPVWTGNPPVQSEG
jgi:hypothetical protein